MRQKNKYILIILAVLLCIVMVTPTVLSLTMTCTFTPTPQDADTIIFTRISQTPANIRMNMSNDSVFVIYNVTTNSTAINATSLFIATLLNHTEVCCTNSTWMLPVDINHPNKRETTNRYCIGTGYWWEPLFNNTGTKSNELGCCAEWGVRNDTLYVPSSNFTINSNGSNWTNFTFEPKIQTLFSRIAFVDISEMEDENKTGQTIDVYSSNLVKVDFNLTDTDFYDNNQYKNTVHTLYFYDGYTGSPSQPLSVYFANNSYDLNPGKPELSPYCELIDSIDYTDPYLYTTVNSSYHKVIFSTNGTGYVGALNMTSNWSIIFRLKVGNVANKFFMYYADGNVTLGGHYHEFNQSETTKISTDNGATWTPRNGTVDCYMTYVSLDDEDEISYKVYAQTIDDGHGNGTWSTIQTDLIDESNYAPNPPEVTSQIINTTYKKGEIVNITYNWLGDPNHETCWVNITVHNETHVLKAWIQNRSITDVETHINISWWYNWDTADIEIGDYYHINITTTDPYNLSSGGTSNGTFNITASTAPVFSFEVPTNNSYSIPVSIASINVTIADPDGDTMNYTLEVSSGDSASGNDVNNMSISVNPVATLKYSTLYTWWVNVTDVINTTNVTYYFTTTNASNITLSFPNPSNGSTNQNVSLDWNITMISPDGDYFQYWINCSNGQTTSASSQSNGSKTLPINGLAELTDYYIFVNVTNNGSNWTREYFNFSTKSQSVNIINPYPANESIDNIRPPVNISAYINGTLINITYNYYNMTPWPHVYSKLYNWSNRNTAPYEVPNLGASGNWSNSFIWGDTHYRWTVNVSNGTVWVNRSYWYNTTGSRYDVTNSGDVISGDVSATWSHRQGVVPYDGMYDVDQTGDIVSNDLSLIWDNRT